jgi:tetratricopeptide (TPR) repeat protein
MFSRVDVREMRRVPSLLPGLIVAVLCSGLALSASAAPDAKAVAKAHYEAATRLYDVHEYGEALNEYKAGYLAKPDASFLFNIGQCYKRLGKPDQAREFFREYLKKAAPDDPNRGQAEARIRELDNREALGSSKSAAGGTPMPAWGTAPEVAPGSNTGMASDRSSGLPSSAAPTHTAGLDPAGVDLSASTTSQPDKAEPAFYQTWWFWGGVGAVVVAGTVTAVLLSRDSGGGSPNVPGTTLGTRTVLQ